MDFLFRWVAIINGATTAAVSTTSEQSFDPNSKQRTDHIGNQAGADDCQYNDAGFLLSATETRPNLFLEVYNEQRSSSCDHLADKNAEEQSDHDGRWSKADGSCSTLDVLTADGAEGIGHTAEDAGNTA